MATLRELDDTLSSEVKGWDVRRPQVAREPRKSRAESLILKTGLTPTDYAEAWALSHYLAQKRGPDFIKFLKSMSQAPPLHPRTPEDHLAEFRKFFGDDLFKLDKRVDEYVRRLSQKKSYDPLPYYAVLVEESLGGGMFRRRAKISQSPQVIQRWLQQIGESQGGMPNCQVVLQPTYGRALLTVEDWMRPTTEDGPSG
jgi:hypothetical protein